MSYRELRFLGCAVLLAFTATSCLRQNHSPSGLPESWYLLPEKGGPMDFRGDSQAEPAVGAQVDRLLGATFDAMDPVAKSQNDDVDRSYHFAGFQESMGISSDGILGLLFLGGTASVETIWGRVKSSVGLSAKSLRRHAPRETSLAIKGQISQPQFDRRLEVLTQSILATGKVADESRLRASLGAIGARFFAITRELDAMSTAYSGWAPQEFRIEASIDASGAVTTGVEVGAAVETRFDWVKEAGDSPAKLAPTSKLASVVTALGQDLDQAYLEAQADELRPFHLSLGQVRLRLGFGLDGDVGIAQGSAEFVGVLCLGRQPAPGEIPPAGAKLAQLELPETIGIFADTRDPEVRAFAASLPGFDKSAGSGLYRVSRAKLRKGLAKAISLGKFFASRAAQAGSTKWKLYELNTEFDVSLSGTTALATVSGIGGVELNFVGDQSE